MPLRTTKPLLAKGEELLSSSRLHAVDELIGICCAGLGHLARETETFHGLVPFSASVISHFNDELHQIIRFLENRPGDDDTDGKMTFFGNVQACAFALVEDMALFMREKKLRSGCAPQHETEERIMAFFESSGNWPKNISEAVIDMYYTQIPLAVMQNAAAAPAP